MHSIFSLAEKRVVTVEVIDKLLEQKKLRLSVLRLDQLHPVASGNKLFKLSHYIDEALKKSLPLLTFGGAYSNHLAATAWLCRELSINCTGLVRGEMPIKLSHTLEYCQSLGMKLKFLSRNLYKQKSEPEFIAGLENEFDKFVLVPEGGAGKKGIVGASEIVNHFHGEKFTHVCLAVGTGTTIAGLEYMNDPNCRLIGFTVLKGMLKPIEEVELLRNKNQDQQTIFNNDYHFGGYAKYNTELIRFMNMFYKMNNIPCDFVYTGKMFYGVWDLIGKDYFPFNSNILCLQTGGLQGNLSLPDKLLDF